MLYINAENMNNILRQKNLIKSKIIRTGNKMLLSYCASVKMLVEKIESFIKHNCTHKEFDDFKKFIRKVYDDNLSYRFVMRLRNYMIHCDMPITIAKTSITDECGLYFNREELLKGKMWSTVREEIEKMPVEIDILPLFFEMPQLIRTIVDESRYYYAQTVSNVCEKIETFAVKHNTMSLAYIIYDEDKGIASVTINTPSINRVERNLEIFQQHPRINVVYHVNHRICKVELIQAK